MLPIIITMIFQICQSSFSATHAPLPAFLKQKDGFRKTNPFSKIRQTKRLFEAESLNMCLSAVQRGREEGKDEEAKG